MQNKTFPIILVLIVVASGGYFLLSKPKNAVAPQAEENVPVNQMSPTVSEETPTTATSTPKQKHEILYTANGFSPAVLSIKVGDTVTFVNKSAKSFRPASNPHPTHTDYSEFDAQTEIANGKTYEFVFTKAGAWGYHNHLNPKMMGVVVVQ